MSACKRIILTSPEGTNAHLQGKILSQPVRVFLYSAVVMTITVWTFISNQHSLQLFPAIVIPLEMHLKQKIEKTFIFGVKMGVIELTALF